MMRFVIAIITIFLSLSALTDCCRAEDNAAPKLEGTIYAYNPDDLPEFFFFPKDKARWDGSKITMREWYMLTDLQKEKFIKEYMGELQAQYDNPINIMIADYLKALNVFSYYSNDKTMNEPSTKFIDKMLVGQGKIERR